MAAVGGADTSVFDPICGCYNGEFTGSFAGFAPAGILLSPGPGTREPDLQHEQLVGARNSLARREERPRVDADRVPAEHPGRVHDPPGARQHQAGSPQEAHRHRR